MTADETAIQAVVNQWMEATRKGDVAAVLALMTDDVVFLTPGRDPFGKAEFAQMMESMKPMKIQATSRILEMQVLGDWAFIRNHITISLPKPGQEPEQRAAHTLTLLHKDAEGQWKLARDANLMLPGK